MSTQLFSLLIGGVIGLFSSLATILVKNRLDLIREKRQEKKEKSAIDHYKELSKKSLSADHPVMTLYWMRDSVQRELNNRDVVDNLTCELMRLYSDLTVQIQNLVGQQDEFWRREGERKSKLESTE